MHFQIHFLMSLLFIFLFSVQWGLCAHLLLNNSTVMLSVSGQLAGLKGYSTYFMGDWMSCFFGGTVSLISYNVFLFGGQYMSNEKYKSRFFYILMVFVLSMMLFVYSSDIVFVIVGWDGLGISSYLLVLFFNSKKSSNASMLTVLSNRIGDLGIVFLMSLWFLEGSWGFHEISGIKYISFTMAAMLCLSAFTKSAQLPFSSWLPAAMAAPTPVSALVHSSTLVTAGVYLMTRMNDLIYLDSCNHFVLLAGSLTMIVSSISSLVEMDMKKIIALSTLSQLGLMVLMLGGNYSSGAFFHMNAHAFFKSALFLGGGEMIHGSCGWQDVRKIYFFPLKEKFLTVLFFSTNMSLMGAPFMSGFYSKDFFLESYFSSEENFMMAILLLSVLLTALYSMRFTWMSILSMHNNMVLMSPASVPPTIPHYSSTLLLLSLGFGSGCGWSTSLPSALVLPPSFSPTIVSSLTTALILSFIFSKSQAVFMMKTVWGGLLKLPFIVPLGVLLGVRAATVFWLSLEKGALELKSNSFYPLMGYSYALSGGLPSYEKKLLFFVFLFLCV